MNIKSGLNTIALGRAVAKLNRYAKLFEGSVADEICSNLAEIGLSGAFVRFGDALYDGLESIELNIEPFKTDDAIGYRIVAEGDTLMFIEFGAGVHYPDSHPLANKFKAKHGTYGKGLGKNDYWFYTGQPGNAGGELAYGHKNSTITHGNPANMPMYNTAQELREKVLDVVREVLFSDRH